MRKWNWMEHVAYCHCW